MFAKHSGRVSMVQTGKTSRRSMVQPQQIHFRLKLIQRWAKKTMRQYAQTQPHKNKRQKLLNLKKFPSNKCWVYHELKTNPICPGCKHHDKPMKSSDGSSRNCVVCSKCTKWICWGCTVRRTRICGGSNKNPPP